MARPFPGMDPWLERAAVWPGVHSKLISTFQDLLVPRLVPRYFADIERRVYILSEDDPAQRLIVPDVAVADVVAPGPAASGAGVGPGGSTEITAPNLLLAIADEAEVREWRLVIRERETRDVVAVIELLSPTNKVAGSRGREEYLAKRREVMRSSAHLVEIDLLRAGDRFPFVDPLPVADYHAHVSRVQLRPRGEVWSWRVRDRLPILPIPLRGGEPDVPLDLAQALDEVYDRVRYDLVLDYDGSPERPLSDQDAAWATQRISAWRSEREAR